MLPTGYKVVETLVAQKNSQAAVTALINSITAIPNELWQPLGPVVCDGRDYMQTLVRLEKLPATRVIDFRTVRVTGDFERLAPYVQAAIAEGGWQPFGPVATGTHTVGNVLHIEYIQTLVKYE